MIWSTDTINFVKNEYLRGISISNTNSPFFQGNENIRKNNLIFKYTEEEINIIQEVYNDVFKLITFLKRQDEPLVLRDYQKKYLEIFMIINLI